MSGNCHIRQQCFVELQHFAEEFPGIIQRQINGWVVEECLKGKAYVVGERSFDDEFLICAMLVDQRGESQGKGRLRLAG